MLTPISTIGDKFDTYPVSVRGKLLSLRKLILQTAEELGISRIEETLKWGQPSYLVKGGSTIRIDADSQDSSRYCMYFNCKSKLVDTFRELYGEQLNFDGNRVVVFSTNKNISVPIIKHCIALSLTYHKVKHLPLLGA